MNKPPTPTSDGNNSPATTIAFPNTIVQSLRDSSRAERTAEEARLMKRARRENQESQTGETSRSASIAPGTPGSSTSGLLGERAPEVDSKKGTKKEQKKHAEAKATEAQQTAATNKTTNMALGLGGSLGKTLSWMQKDVPSGNSKLPALARVNTSTQGLSRSSTTNNLGSGFHLPMGRRHGQFREDKEKGAHIQLRDVVFAMESDRKDKRAMAKTYTILR